MDPVGIAIGLAAKVVEKVYDRFAAAHGVRLELEPGLTQFADGSIVALIILTVRNRSRPQSVESAYLTLSNKKRLQLAGPALGFKPMPRVVSETEPYEVGFDLAGVRRNVTKHRQGAGDRPVGVVGASVKLASGRTVSVRKKIDIDNDALFQFKPSQ